MKKDRYDNPISTTSDAARDLYITGVDRLLEAGAGVVPLFEAAIEADPGFALGHAGLARAFHTGGNLSGAKAAITTAQSLARDLDTRQRGHIHAFDLLIHGKGPQAYAAIRAHVDAFPRDALVAQTCSSIFGLIGFSGQPGREAEMLAFNAALLPHYGDDWWCLSQYAFALCETGNPDKAATVIDRSLAMNANNANGAHIRSHVYYEAGQTELGIAYLENWLTGYDRTAILHGHLAWHVALWALGQGDTDRMWQRIDADVKPGAAQGLPINVLTDTASIFCRAELAGVPVPPERWAGISAYATQFFPDTSLAFVDFHAAIAHAMAGDGAALNKIIETPKGPAADMVRDVASAYRAMAQQNWGEATQLFTRAMGDHARLGGSRAQRDLLEFSLLSVLLKQGHDAEASRLLSLRRPTVASTGAVHGLSAH